jgi:signal transduction histidine kinase
MKPLSIVALTVVAVAALGAAAYWDERKEAAAALGDFAREQAALAREVAASLRSESERSGSSGADTAIPRAGVRSAFAPIEEPGVIVAFLRVPGGLGLATSSSAVVHLPRLEAALDATPCSVDALTNGTACTLELSHDDSVRLGLPPRMGMAGLAAFATGDGRRGEVAVVATAERERDRERRAAARLVLSFLVSSGLVLALGLLALGKLRRELALAAELAVAEAVRARDDRLVRADKLATMGALATGIAHEVATPLGVIVGRAEQLTSRVSGDERAQRSVVAILEQAARIEQVIRAFLTLARGGTPSLEHTEPGELTKAAVDLVLHRFAQAGVSVSALSGAPVPLVACDRRLLEQALVNLLLNACDACSAGESVTIEVQFTGGQVAFIVIDDGAGITREAAARATEPFFTTKPEGKGTGLGLAIAREIVEHHRGTLTVAPRTGLRGTEARINLPPVAPPRETHGPS